MRKLIIQEWISLDGYAADRAGELDFFASRVRETYADEYQQKFLKTIDCILLGRKTYERFVTLWPGRPTEGDLLAARMNTGHKIVFSNSLTTAPWGKWKAATIATGDPVPAVRQLKSGRGKNMVLWASLSLAQLLMREGLADEYHLFVCPAITGGGRKLFPEGMDPVTLTLTGSKHYHNGVISLDYQVLPSNL